MLDFNVPSIASREEASEKERERGGTEMGGGGETEKDRGGRERVIEKKQKRERD